MDLQVDSQFRGWLPSLSNEERAALEKSILEDGCRDALVIWAGHNIIVDGHNRYDICQRHHVPFGTYEMEFANRDAVIDWIERTQMGRRNLTMDELRFVRGRRYEREKKAQNDGGKGTPKTTGGQNDHQFKTAAKVASDFGVSEKTIRRDAEYYRALKEQAGHEPVLADVSDLTTATRALKEKTKSARIAALQDTSGDFAKSEKRYRVFYADPPWQYCREQHTTKEQETVLGSHYPSMSISELCALPVREKSLPDAVLFLWATSTLLQDAFDVLDAWGFRYKASMVWDKVKHNVGHYVSVRHEFLLISTRGACTPDVKTLHDSVQSIERTEHSVKPERFREIIDEIYPHGPRIELFARRDAKGWDKWGNQ